MNNGGDRKDTERLSQQAAQASADRAVLEQFTRENPQLAPLLSSAKPEDFARLRQILSDPALTKRILATKKAQSLLEAIKKGKLH